MLTPHTGARRDACPASIVRVVEADRSGLYLRGRAAEEKGEGEENEVLHGWAPGFFIHGYISRPR